MQTNWLRCCAWITCCCLTASLGQAADGDNFQQNEFPARPTPAWVKMIDQGTLNPELKGIETPAGVKVEIVAQEPTIINPVGMTFDERGTPWVLEWTPGKSAQQVNYEVQFRDGTKGTVHRMQKDSRDILKVLQDENQDGVYEKSQNILTDLEIPSSVLVDREWVYLSGIGHVVRYPRKGLEVKNEPQEIVRGLCGFHHHQASGLTLSHDGWLYVTSGDDDNLGEGSDGSRAVVLRTGAVFRMRPDGSQLTEHARGFRNPYRDVVFDHFFNMFHVDNDQEDGSKFQGVRLMHVQAGADYGWRLLPGAVCCRTDFVRGAAFGEAPGKMPSMLKTGRGSPAGLLIYQGTRFPAFFRGLLIYPDVYRKLVRAYQIEREGSTFKVIAQFDLMRSQEGLFRPCQAVAGPDGAIYIVDWRCDSGGAGKLWGDGQHGRIYRLSWQGTPETHPAIPLAKRSSWAELSEKNEDELLLALEQLDFELRFRAQRELLTRGPQVQPKLLGLLKDSRKPAHARAMALGAVCQKYTPEVETALVRIIETDKEAELRRMAAEAIGAHAQVAHLDENRLISVWSSLEGSEQDPAVQRALALTVGRLASLYPAQSQAQNAAIHALTRKWMSFDAEDVYLKDGLIRALESAGEPGITALVEMAQTGQEEDREKAVAALEAMRTRPAVLGIDKILQGETSNFSVAHLRRLIATYPQIVLLPAQAPTAVESWLKAHPQAPVELQLAALETLGLCGRFQSPEVVQLTLALLNAPEEATRLRVTQTIGQARLTSAALPLAEAFQDGKRSVAERRAMLQALGGLRSYSLPFLAEKSPPGVELCLDQLTQVIRDPASGVLRGETLQLLGQVDFGRAEPLAWELLAGDDLPNAAVALEVLGSQPERAKKIATEFKAGKVSRALLPQVLQVVRRHVPQDKSGEFAKLAAEVVKGGLLVGLDPAAVQRVEQLVSVTGNVERGRSLYLDAAKTQCVNCHKLEGLGGQVGPDLTKIWQTHTVAKILESILDPNKEIKEGYATYAVTNTNGQVFSGLKVREDEREIVLRAANGQDVRVPQSEIEEKVATQQSLMPEGVIAQLSYEELVDLVAFLKQQAAQQALRVRPLSVQVAGPLPVGADGPPADANRAGAEPLMVQGQSYAWRTIEPAADGRFDVRPGNAQAGDLLARCELEATQPQTIELLLWAAPGVELWSGGKKVYTAGEKFAEATVAYSAVAGKQTLLLRVPAARRDVPIRLFVKPVEGVLFK